MSEDVEATADEGLGRWSRIALLAVAVVLLLFTKDGPGSWADGSRLATIQAIAEQGVLHIDDTEYFWQGDKVWFEPHYYSHQPPMLALIGALPYALLHHVLGLSITDPWSYRAITWVCVGLPLLGGLWSLARLSRRAGMTDGTAALLLLAIFGASHVLPYALVLNQHGAAAGWVVFALWLVVQRRTALAGFVLALATTIDLTAVFFALAVLIPVIAQGKRAFAGYAAGAVPILALHFSINLGVAGDLRPFGLHLEAFEYPMSPFMLMNLTGSNAGDAAGSLATYAQWALIGRSGVFSHHPWLLLLLAAAIAAVLRPSAARLGRPLGWAALLGSFGVLGYYLLQSRNLGGSSFGMRWFTVFMPALAIGAAGWLGGVARRPGPFLGTLLALLLAVSTGTAVLGAKNPWMKFHWRYEHSPQGMVHDPAEPKPSPAEHLRKEWKRLALREPINRNEYDLTFIAILGQYGKLYLGRAERMAPGADRDTWLQQGIDKLLEATLEMDRGRDAGTLRGVQTPMHAHFWLGKLYAAQGDLLEARRHYLAAKEIAPTWEPANIALEALERRLASE
ncbi:MAG: hypothetical protein ACYS26_14975 [Planctomycetota bacterium]